MARIVVAEDDPDIHLLIQILLEDQGHAVVMTKNGTAALEAIRASQPDLVMMDIAMPGEVDGLQATRLLRADPETSALPILLLSARARQDDVSAGMDAGATSYVVKPFDADELIDAVAALVP